ncbi:MAG: HAMP domain-containing sensor histidine kinase [Bacteroidia bacterium]|nr:HAMP domain-containing sensor histidine kinase [Bacteroidia bacterium]
MNRNTLSISLMFGSLALLLVFQFLWLRNAWLDERDNLRNEADRLFVNSIREIEDSLFQQIYLDPLVVKINREANITYFNSQQTQAHDTLQQIIIRGEKLPTPTGRDSTFRFTFRSRFDEKDNQKRQGSISLFVAMTDTLLSRDSVPPLLRQFSLKPLLEQKFAEEIKNSALNFSYTLGKASGEDSLVRGIVTHSYIDIPSKQSYAVYINDYQGFILKKIVPEVLFSLFLFVSISLAYFLTYRNLRNQQRLNQLKNDFISNVTHELKTPITTVSVAIEALRNFNALDDPNRTREYLDISQQELNRLAILVDRVLKMSLFEKAEPELKMETVNLREIIQEILGSMKLQFERLSAKVSFYSPETPFSLTGDRLHLTSVVYNLIDNALKYGGEKPQIEISLGETSGQIRLSVKDFGMGIAAEYREKIFEKFFRVPTGDRHNIKGHGLGLSYVASVVEKHQGTISVESQPGKGSCFTVLLPADHG